MKFTADELLRIVAERVPGGVLEESTRSVVYSRGGLSVRADATETEGDKFNIRCNYRICTHLEGKYDFPEALFGGCVPVGPTDLFDVSTSGFSDAQMSCVLPGSIGVDREEADRFVDAVVRPCVSALLELCDYRRLADFLTRHRYLRGFPEVGIAVLLEAGQLDRAKSVAFGLSRSGQSAKANWADRVINEYVLSP